MDWSKAGDSNHIYMSDMPDLSAYDNPTLEIGNNSQPEVIDLDGYSPVQAHYQHDEISCKDDVLVVFPDICPDYLAQLAIQHNYQPGSVLSAIVDTQEKTGSYPTQISPESNPLKRKRGGKSNDNVDDGSDSSDEGDPECVRTIKLQIAAQGYPDIMRSAEYAALGKILLSQEFPRVPQSFIRASLQPKKDVSNKSVFETYTAIAEHIRNWDNTNKPWQEKKTLTKANPDFAFDKLQNLDMSGHKPGEQAAFAEFVAAKKFRAIKDARIAAETEEQNNFLRAKNEGQTIDCGICFEECPLNRMVRCEGETMHWFCRKCLRTQAESLIGMAKYELTCMSLDGCSAGFSRGQKKLFLSPKLTVALDRIEQEAVLRMAGIENLETCPFCPYAAEYPPVEVDKEFRCEDPSCRRVSCRLCRKETHIPRTCAEVEADRGRDARHALEEAKSEALIRRCNNCQNPFIKTDGCNKVRCTKCRTLQCDVCRKTITSYAHFNDTTRGGKTGQCPLYDESRGRYEKEVSSAETEMLKKIVAENPDLDEKVLGIPVSEKAHPDTSKPKMVIPAIHRPLRAHFGGAFGHVGAFQPEFGFGHLPNLQVHDHILNRAKDVNPGIPAVRIPTPLNPVPRLNGIMDRVRPADGVVREAQRTPKRRESPVIFSSDPSYVAQAPAPHPLSLEVIMNKVENMKKLRFGEARRQDGEVKRPNEAAQPNPFLAIPPLNSFQQHLQQRRSHIHQAQTQGVIDPTQLQRGVRFPPFPAASGSINGGPSLVNAAGPVVPLPPNFLNWDRVMGE